MQRSLQTDAALRGGENLWRPCTACSSQPTANAVALPLSLSLSFTLSSLSHCSLQLLHHSVFLSFCLPLSVSLSLPLSETYSLSFSLSLSLTASLPLSLAQSPSLVPSPLSLVP